MDAREERSVGPTGHNDEGALAPGHVWTVCGFLFLGTVLNYLDRQVLSLTAEKIIAEYHLTKESF